MYGDFIDHFAVIAHPTAEWPAQRMREAFPPERAPLDSMCEWPCGRGRRLISRRMRRIGLRTGRAVRRGCYVCACRRDKMSFSWRWGPVSSRTEKPPKPSAAEEKAIQERVA